MFRRTMLQTVFRSVFRYLGIFAAGLLFSANLWCAPITIDTTSRTAVSNAYNNIWVPAHDVSPGWSGGNISGCVAGTTTLAHQQATIDTANFYRALAKLPSVKLITDATPTDPTNQIQNSDVVARARAAALYMAANHYLTHTPSTTDGNATHYCLTQEAIDGAGASNLFLGYGSPTYYKEVTGPGAIDGYIDDNGNESSLGHRRWILYTQQVGLATGDIPNTASPYYSSNALRVFATGGEGSGLFAGSSPYAWVAWPSPNFVPYQLIPTSGYWSIAYPMAIFTGATVTMTTSGGVNVPVTVKQLEYTTGGSYMGDNTLLFEPSGANFNAGSAGMADTSYKIEVSGVTGAPSSTYCYTVTVFDPATSGNATAPDLCNIAVVNAQTPTITSQPQGAVYALNTPATPLWVVASVWDGGSLSYQWYRNTANSASGGTPIAGEIGESYTPPTDAMGTLFYYVVVTNTNNAVNGTKVVSTTSNVIAVTATTAVGSCDIDLSNTAPAASAPGCWTFIDSGKFPYGSDGVYSIVDGADLTVTGNNAGSQRRLEVADNATATIRLNNATIAGLTSPKSALSLVFASNVTLTLILADGSDNTLAGAAWPGIFTSSSTTLIIDSEAGGTGKLTALGDGLGSGIGGQSSIGTIIVNGGNITATGGTYTNGTIGAQYVGAGIGSCWGGGNGSIIINGGTINATGGALYVGSGAYPSAGGAGIGSGMGGSNVDVTINGGTITANGGGYGGAGIGSGH
ncbi:MAG: carbohydrate-binding domain-containing protein, partial [Burkholderiales bacterium]|nr:carbohydrate-binding domain-containing protein [Burkholderiales bacterium]